MTRSCEEDPAFDYLLTLFLEATGEPLTVLPTHRLRARHRRRAARRTLLRAPASCSRSNRSPPARRSRRAFGSAGAGAGGAGRFGLWTRAGGAVLRARRAAFEPFLPAGGDGPARPGRHAARGRPGAPARASMPTPSPAARSASRSRPPTPSPPSSAVTASMPRSCWRARPSPSIEAVARDGDVMPQKSTYFYPKALTGLVINPHEW